MNAYLRCNRSLGACLLSDLGVSGLFWLSLFDGWSAGTVLFSCDAASVGSSGWDRLGGGTTLITCCCCCCCGRLYLAKTAAAAS